MKMRHLDEDAPELGELANAFDATRPELVLLGHHVVQRALMAGATPNRLFVTPAHLQALIGHLQQVVQVFVVEPAVLTRATPYRAHRGCVALLKRPALGVVASDDVVQAPALDIMLVGVGDPHNVGAIARTAYALGVRRLLLAQSADPFDPRAVRASAGWVFALPMAVVPAPALYLTHAVAHGVTVVGTAQNGDSGLALLRRSCAHARILVLGSEEQGLARACAAACSFHVRVPLLAHVDSLNVAVAAGIVVHAWQDS